MDAKSFENWETDAYTVSGSLDVCHSQTGVSLEKSMFDQLPNQLPSSPLFRSNLSMVTEGQGSFKSF